jgi:superfamily II DNA/RNA helicase
MIFAQFRDTVEEICELLAPHAPHIKSMPFVGQGVGRSSAGFTQKEQSRVIEEFKKGGYNTLVSTCIGEEGLDIGEVDLIICFDAQASPTRMVQRMGRTGRKRDGRCGTTSTTLHSWAFAPPPSVRSQTDDWGGHDFSCAGDRGRRGGRVQEEPADQQEH